jgi:hypothetical protein
VFPVKERTSSRKNIVLEAVKLIGRTAGLARRAAKMTADRIFDGDERKPIALKSAQHTGKDCRQASGSGGFPALAQWVSVRLLPGRYRSTSTPVNPTPSGNRDRNRG